MWRLILFRLLVLVPVLFFASMIVFFIMHLIPGDAASAIAGADVTPEALEALREKMGLNDPLYAQYLIWLGFALSGDLGVSNVSHIPVIDLLGQRLPATLELTSAAIVIAVSLAIPVGILAAIRQRRMTDKAVSAITSFGLAIPEYWSGLIAIIVFSVMLGWLPPGGRVPPGDGIILWLKSLTLPAVALAIPIASMQARFVRASLIEVLQEPYILTARSKGLPAITIILVHAVRNALIPLMTVVGIQMGRLMGGAILVESIFNWPGIGRLIVQSISQRDYNVVLAAVLLIVFIFAIINTLVDILYGAVDPRLRRIGTSENG